LVNLHSFPTRRSSDLGCKLCTRYILGCCYTILFLFNNPYTRGIVELKSTIRPFNELPHCFTINEPSHHFHALGTFRLAYCTCVFYRAKYSWYGSRTYILET